MHASLTLSHPPALGDVCGRSRFPGAETRRYTIHIYAYDAELHINIYIYIYIHMNIYVC